jgi:hypothetical protein
MNQQILFSQPPGDVGPVYPYTLDDVTVTAYGYEIGSPNQQTNMYGNNDGPNKIGLGINANPQKEIDDQTFICLDLSNIISQNCEGTPTVTVSSIEPTETFSIYGTNTLGDLGTFLISSSDLTVDIPMFGTYKYICITASGSPNPTVLIYSINYTLCECKPEPCVPTPVDMTLEILPVVTLCVQKPFIKIKNNAVCICKPCKSAPRPPL